MLRIVVMEEQMEKAKNLMEKSKTFALFSLESSEDFELLLREALALAVSQKGKVVYRMPELHTAFKEKWSSLLPQIEENKILHNTAIKMPAGEAVIKEVSYDKVGDDLVIKIISENGGLTSKLEMDEYPTSVDAMVCFFADHKGLERFQGQITFPLLEEIVFLSANHKTTTEKVFDMIKAILGNKELDETVASLMLGALILETDNFANSKRKEVLDLETELLKAGGDKKAIFEICEMHKAESFPQLLGRALARTRENDELKSVWSFIPIEDFEKTGTKEKIENDSLFIHQIARNLKNIIPQKPFMIVLWQTTPGVRGLIKSYEESDANLCKLAKSLKVPVRTNFVITSLFKNFSEAEININQALKELFL